MGYFRRKLRRRDAGQAAGEFRSTTPMGEWTDASRTQIEPDTFVRFAIDGQYDPVSARHAGIFVDFDERVDLNAIPREVAAAAQAAMRWFNANLPVPRLSKRNAIFWFRSSQREMIDRAFAIIAALRAGGHVVHQLQTTRPGKRVYEDTYQVAAIPWAETDLAGEAV